MAKVFSQVRQQFYNDCEAALNKFANLEFTASYVYMAMAYHFDRDDCAMEGFRKFFMQRSHEEHEAAEKILAFQNIRGGRIELMEVYKPRVHTWDSGLHAMETALALEKGIKKAALDLHALAGERSDVQTCDWLESNFFQSKLESIKLIGDHITNLKKVGDGHGEYYFEKETLTES